MLGGTGYEVWLVFPDEQITILRQEGPTQILIVLASQLSIAPKN